MKFTSTNRRQPPTLKTLPLLIFLAAFLGSLPSSYAQLASCTYTIRMFDSFGDGWNGAFLKVTSNGVVTTHTLPDPGSSGTSTFTVVHGKPVILEFSPGNFGSEIAYELVSPDGAILYYTGPVGAPAPPSGVVFDRPGFCPTCPAAPNAAGVFITQITDSTALINWADVNSADSYVLEYGPSGFPLGYGLTVDSTSSIAKLTGLNPCVNYDVYIYAICGADSTSSPAGPFTFQTPYPPPVPGPTCTYTLELFDSFGDGWGSSRITVTTGGVSTNYTINSGFTATHTFTATGNFPIVFSYTAGTFQNEIRYNIKDPSGAIIYSAGPNPPTGVVFSTLACPTCPGPLDMWMSDINATNAKVSWQPAAGATGTYVIEYGPLGFTLGTGSVVTAAGNKTVATLPGLLENSWYDVYMTLDCGAEFAKRIGPVTFQTIWVNDVGVSSIIMPSNTSCDLGNDEKVTIGLHNYGQAPQTLFQYFFAVNGEAANISPPQDGLFTGVVGNDSTQFISFETNWDFSMPGRYVVEAWTVLDKDSNPANDTFRLVIQTAFSKPLYEDFEDNAVPDTWTHDGVIFAPNAHNNPTRVLADNLWVGDQTFTVTTQRIGPIVAGDTLTFDYRFTNWSAGTTGTPITNDKLEVQVSADCGMTYQTLLTINAANHVVSNQFAHKVIPLSHYVGQAVSVRFVTTWAAGDYWIDLDNINIAGCPPSLNLSAVVTDSEVGGATGNIKLTPFFGTPPFQFIWVGPLGDTVATTQNVFNIPGGIYLAEVTDLNGCKDFLNVEVGTFVDAGEVVIAPEISMYPNPTSGMAFLDVKFEKTTDFQVRLLNMSGQVLFYSERHNENLVRQELDLTNQPPGMYIVQIVANGRPYHAKLIVAK